MKILITGGAGFIGSNFIYYMLNKYTNYSIVCIDNLTYAGNLETLKYALDKKMFKFIKADITDREKIFSIFEEEKFDYVVNFAAESHVDNSILNPAIFIKTNVIGTQVLMDASKMYNIKRFHQVSTDEVYGDLPLDRKELSFNEQNKLKPSSPYSASKASADLLVLSYYRTFGLPTTISRCSNNYGPFHFPEKLIPLVIKNALENKPIPVYGTGNNIRDWLHVDDHCNAIDLIIHKGKNGMIYNVGGNQEKTNIYIVNLILDLLNKSKNLIKFVEDRKGHDLRYAIDSSKIRNELGWKPKHYFDEAIDKVVKWNIENKQWIDKVSVKKINKEEKNE